MKDQEDNVTREFDGLSNRAPSFSLGEYVLSNWMQREFEKVSDLYRRDCEKTFKNFNHNISTEMNRLTKSIKSVEARIESISKAVDKIEGTKKPTN